MGQTVRTARVASVPDHKMEVAIAVDEYLNHGRAVNHPYREDSPGKSN